MTGILRSSSCIWQRLLATSQTTANPARRCFAEQSERVRNTSKVLAAEKKGTAPNKITLHGPDGSMSITSLEDAQKLAKRRGLKLAKQTDLDGKSQRPVYKLITIAKIKQDELEATSDKSKSAAASLKGEKMLSLNNKISEHDIQTRLKHIEKWLAKQHKVIVVISGTVSDLATSERIFKQMEEVAQGSGGRVVQKRSKGSEIRFQILPIAPQMEGGSKAAAGDGP